MLNDTIITGGALPGRNSGALLAALAASAALPANVAAAEAPLTLENPLRELFAAERMLLGAGANAKAYRSQAQTRGVDPAELAARRLREKRRQKAKQAARRLKASRS